MRRLFTRRTMATVGMRPARLAPALSRSAGSRFDRGASGLALAQAACVVGLVFAAVSVYWGLGGTWLLDTTNESIERSARAGEAGVFVAVWAAAVLKVMAAMLPLLALRPLRDPTWSRRVWVLAWIAAAIATLYGLIATTLAQLTLHDVIHTPAVDDRRHVWLAFVWEPWFLLWGVMIGGALLLSRATKAESTTRWR